MAAAGAHADAVREAWAQVGVAAEVSGPAVSTPGPGASGTGSPAPGWRCGVPAASPGMTVAGEVDLADDDPRGGEVRTLLDRIDLAAVRRGLPQPDHFVYDFDLGGRRAVVPEQHLTDDLRRLVELVLENGQTR